MPRKLGFEIKAIRGQVMGETVQPTPRELEILAILWETGEATVRQVYQHMRSRDEDLAQNTVQTFLRTMQDKGLVKHYTSGRAFVFQPVYSREQSVASFVDKVFQGAADQLVVSLLRAKKLTPEEVEAIERLIRQAKLKERKRR